MNVAGSPFDPRVVDTARDSLSAILGGLFLMGLGGVIALFRRIRERLNRHGMEIRHTQKETSVDPVFPEYPADKL
jgi:hypothetical protein